VVPLDTQVLVVGAGPVGLTLANILGLHGIRTLLVERNASTVGEPRAVSIDDESLRTMQYIGLDDVVRSRIVPGYGSHYFSAGGSCFARVVPDTLEYGFPRRSAFRQPILEAQLREGLERFEAVETRFSTSVEGIADRGTHVEATLRAQDDRAGGAAMGTDLVRAQYAVACDGARSPVREALGIPMGGSTYDCQWLIVDLAGSTDRFRHTRVFCDPARPGLALPGPDGTRRYEFMLLPGEAPEAMLDEANVRALLARRSREDASLAIVRKVVYHFHARLAERWREGRIFLAGDAAHLSPPFAGQGMNSGIRDAQNLGWKLAWCLRGALGERVLATYETERKPHAAALIRMAVRMGHVMMPRSPLRALATQAAFRALALYRPARDYVMQMKWKPLPRFTEGLLAGDAGAGVRGRMFPQPRVETRDGGVVLLDTLLGSGFAVIEWDDGELPLAPARTDRPLDARLVRVVPRDHRFVGAPAVETVRDASGAIGMLFERAALRGAVLRPDRYVAAGIARDAGAGECDRLLEEIRAQTF
jgi:3-(3-hydroxy-phenyl)propionate hydroxylase